MSAVARRKAYALPRLSFGRKPDGSPKPRRAARPPRRNRRARARQGRLLHGVDAPENTREGADVSPERLMLRRQATRPTRSRSSRARSRGWAASTRRRRSPRTRAWACARTRTSSSARCSSTGKRWPSACERSARASTPPARCAITGDGTDLTFSLEGRHGHVDAIGANMPGGEVFYSPVEDSADGTVAFSEYPGDLRRPGRRERHGSASRAAAPSTPRRRATRTSC